jgi:hypothetical protein
MADVNSFAASIEKPFRHDWPDCPRNLESHARKTGAHKQAVHSSKSPAEADANPASYHNARNPEVSEQAASMLGKVLPRILPKRFAENSPGLRRGGR